MSEQSNKVSSDPKTSNGKGNAAAKNETPSEITSTSLSVSSVSTHTLPAFAKPPVLTSTISSTSAIGSQSGFFSSALSSLSSSSSSSSSSSASSHTSSTSTSSSSTSGFVFGQNLHEKITSSSCTATSALTKSNRDGDKKSSDSGSEATASSSTPTDNGDNGSCGLFSAALHKLPKLSPAFASSSSSSSSSPLVSSSTTTATTLTTDSKREQSTASEASASSSSTNNIDSAKADDTAATTSESTNATKTASDAAEKNETPSTSKPDEPRSGMLFCDLLKTGSSNGGSIFAASNSNNKRSLSEAAIECEESRPQKRKPEEITVVTGEEDETNKFQTNCKIFAFDSATKTWKERGNAVLRLNDKINDSTATFESRIIVRSLGIQKIILNTKIWGDMTVEKANMKSIRFTAIDHLSGDIKIFLISMNPEKMKDLYELIKLRIAKEQSKTSENKNDCKPIVASKAATALV